VTAPSYASSQRPLQVRVPPNAYRSLNGRFRRVSLIEVRLAKVALENR
jgi:hypothetical protein